MSSPSKSQLAKKLPKKSYPRCFRCQKPVDQLQVISAPNQLSRVTIEFHCHGESASQDVSAELLTGEHGLSAYTAFNDLTSGLLPIGYAPQRASRKRGGKK